MNIRYSVFLGNVGGCFDRYCPGYSRDFSTEELFRRAASVPHISAVDLVMTEGLKADIPVVRRMLSETGLGVASVAVDTFANPVFQRGSFSSTDKAVRGKAISDARDVIDFAVSVGCKTVTLWPGQDGYDYIFAADYIKERQLFSDAMAELCDYNHDVNITMEYKIKEPRTHSYISTCGATLLMCQTVGAENLGIALDYGHASLGYETPAEAVAMCKMYGDRLMHIHINDNYRLWDDDMIVGSVHTAEYLEFMYWLKRTGYRGYITADQYPYREDGRDAVNESIRWLKVFEEVIDRADPEEIENTISERDGVAASRLIRKLIFNV